MQGDSSESSGAARTVARFAGLAALIIVVVLAVIVLFDSEDGHQYELIFETGGQLVPGNEVLVGGQPIGSIDEIDLTDDAQANVTITVDEPLHEGTTAMVRSTSLSGIANRYVSIAPGPNSEPELEDGAVITADRTTSPVDLDQLFNTLDAPTRKALQDVIQGQAEIYTGNNEEARETYKYFAPGLQATERLLAELTRDQASLSRFLVEGSNALGAIAERRDDLAELTSNGNEAFGAIAERNADLEHILDQLPPAMRQANTTFVNVRAALDDFDPLFADLGDVAPDLPPFLRDLRSVVDPSIPVFRNLTKAVDRPGANNDLTDSLRKLPKAEKAARKSVVPTLNALDDSQDNVAIARAYTPDLTALIGRLSQVTAYYDANGHYARVSPANSNLFNNAAGALTPIAPSQQFDPLASLGLGPFQRCPGGSTQPNAGWPSPTDHPFLGGGILDGKCDPSDTPPGP